jgi:cyclophilin family peptidyl-prolyl cis-trans isomerase
LSALVAGGVRDAPALVAEAAGAADRWLRARAAEGAAVTGDGELLLTLARDAEPPVRAAAVDSLARLGDLEAVVAALGDRHPAVRSTALDLLAEAPELPTARVVVLIEEARRDGAQNDVRLAGVRVLAARAKTPPARDRATIVQALGRLVDDADWLLRRAAADALEALGEPRPGIGAVPTGRELSAYLEVLRQSAAPRRAAIETSRGRLVVELACPEAPTTCLSFLQLAAAGFFDGTPWHRVVPDFVVQGGDPGGDGWGGPGYALRDEINRLRYRRGTLGMALSVPDTGGSQFFVTLAPQPHLDGGYTVFGRVVEGDERLDQLRQGDRIVSVRELPAGAAGALR